MHVNLIYNINLNLSLAHKLHILKVFEKLAYIVFGWVSLARDFGFNFYPIKKLNLIISYYILLKQNIWVHILVSS